MAGTSDEEMIRLLTQGLDTVMVNVRYKNHTFQIPACRKNSNESYRISHRTLLYFYQKLRRECRDVKICMKPEWKKCEVNYSIAACTVVTQDGESDLYFGENKQTPISTGVNSNSPFQIAVNRAMDKAIFYEIFGLPSRYFDNDGNSILFTDIDNVQKGDEYSEPSPSASQPVQHVVSQPTQRQQPVNNQTDEQSQQGTQTKGSDSAPKGQRNAEDNKEAKTGSSSGTRPSAQPTDGRGGTEKRNPDRKVLEKEFLELGEFELQVKKPDGQYGNISLKNMNDKLLASFSEALKKSSDKVSRERQKKPERFRELRDMLSNASASG